MAEGACARNSLTIVDVAERTFYYAHKAGTRRRRATVTTLDADGTLCTEEQLVALITTELEREFVDYGYIKVTQWLQHGHKLLINKKKLYRMMSKHGLLNSRPVRSTIRK